MAELNTAPEKQGKKVRTKKQALRVDLTAMVDLAFLLITFFMLTTTLSLPKVMNVAMPDSTNDPEPQAASRTMTICLGKDNHVMYYLGEAKNPIMSATLTNYSKSGLRHAIMDVRQKVLAATSKSMMVIIKPGDTSVYENLVSALDEMKITDVQQYAIADIDTKDISMLKDKQAY
ncbi:biopolymer transporter ExbD [Mucilaginibacter sp. ZT4R22]|uniref:Biopolymer transporter ExbD n=1 Tax=Mucilaginibacter pankratovii TaxID=2772110 RepID=A0ABR7WSC7_9SPHI|nr:biopolymer transporter ExbD [Mucilaginibacter pankratovii]MBD1365206.1 biopolymer transporter ExbD [Mucilaginibacter pankratovii]